MNRKALSLYLLAATAVVTSAGCDAAIGRENRSARSERGDVTITRSWPAAQIDELKVVEVDGSVKVEAADVQEITLVARVRGDLEKKAGQENDGLFETKLTGGTLRIGRDHDKKDHINIPFIFGRREMRIDYELKVPRNLDLALTTVNGKIVTHGSLEGETRLATVNGTIDVETAGTRELSATTVNGRVRAKFLTSFSGAEFKSVNGGVEATLPQSASFSVDLSQLNGDFEAAFPLSIHSNPGSRRVSGEVNGGQHELKITTVNGDVELMRLGKS
jgi:DUF4097 and DUF4098 domain-containing protein YvlB